MAKVSNYGFEFLVGLFLGSFLLPILAPAYAEEEREALYVADSGVFNYDGLLFPCEGCSVAPGAVCSINSQGEKKSLPCKNALTFLLSEAFDRGYDGERPSAGQIRNYLFSRTVKGKNAEYLLELMCKSELGRESLSQEAVEIYKRYGDALRKLIARKKCKPEIWLRFLKLPETEGVPVDRLFRATVMARHPDFTLADLLLTVDPSDIQKALEEIIELKNILYNLRSGWVESLDQVIKVLTACAEMGKGDEMPAGCTREEIDQLPKDIKGFLQGVQLQGKLKQIQRDELTAPELLKEFREIQLFDSQDPSVLKLVVESLDRTVGTEAEDKWVQTNLGSDLNMLDTFSKHDADIRYHMGLLLYKLAAESWKLDKPEDAIGLTERSFVVYDESINVRKRFIEELLSDPNVRRHEVWRQRLEKLYFSEEEEEESFFDRLSSVDLKPLIIALAALLGLFVIAYQVSRIKGKLTPKVVREPLNFAEMYELQELMQYFGLPEYATAVMLQDAYLARIKGSHHGGPPINVAEISANYRRAKALVDRRSG